MAHFFQLQKPLQRLIFCHNKQRIISMLLLRYLLIFQNSIQTKQLSSHYGNLSDVTHPVLGNDFFCFVLIVLTIIFFIIIKYLTRFFFNSTLKNISSDNRIYIQIRLSIKPQGRLVFQILSLYIRLHISQLKTASL